MVTADKDRGRIYAATAFSFLYAGTVLGSPLYTGGHTVVRFAADAAAILAYTPFCMRYFECRTESADKGALPFVAVAFSFFCGGMQAVYLSQFVRSLGDFSPYYARLPVCLFAVLACIGCALYGVFRGKNAVFGLTTAACGALLLWTAAGWLGFLTTGRIAYPSPPFAGITPDEWAGIAAEALMPCAEITVLCRALYAETPPDKRSTLRRYVYRGTAAGVLLAGVNVSGNLLLLGDALCRMTDNPDLAAVRLVPMFDLPEVSILVGVSALVIKLAVLSYASYGMLRGAFGRGKREIVRLAALGGWTALAAGLFLLCGVRRGARTALLFAVAGVLCLIFCSGRKITGNGRRDSTDCAE